MPNELKYAGNNYIKQDLRRLKSLRSLSQDIETIFTIVRGHLAEMAWPPPFHSFGGMITQFDSDNESFLCFKERVPITNPKLTPAQGCRLIFALDIGSRVFIPLLLYRANEEGRDYQINGKKFKLTSGNLGKIINQKLLC